MKPLFPFICAAILSAAGLAHSQDFRTFTNTDGKSIEAKVQSIDGNQVTIVLQTGAPFTIPIASLSPADQEFLKTWTSSPLPASGVNAEAINAAIGQQLFAETPLWESEPSSVAARLGWPRESETLISESYRAYPKEDYRFLGARPFSAALYGENNKVTGISIVFANKGDSFSAAGSGEDHFIEGKPVPGGMDGVRVLMEHDERTIASQLTSLLGEPESTKFGEGESRVTAERWDWAGHSFLLSHVEEEYVSLSIQTIDAADDRGRAAKISDAVIRERVRGFVETRENGDVVVTNIPMVDQGPKGYCVPATAERIMRFLGIPADMYLLAMAGETQAGGGTSVDLLLSNIGSDIKRKGRSFDIETGKLKMRDIKRSIDDGIPIMWALFSTSQFNDTASERTKKRNAVSWGSYREQVLEAAENPSLSPDRDRGHVVIIIGYNEETNEIAFSDSWGERYLERWITIPEAEQVSQSRFYIIGL